MAAFAYRAVDGAGKAFSGVVEAVSAAAARADLRGRGLLPVEVTAAQTAGQPFRAALPLQALVLVTRQMATLLQSGLRIEDALAIIAQGQPTRVAGLMMAVRTSVLEGRSFAAAIDLFPRAFSAFYRASVAAGEASGRLDQVMAHLANFVENRARNRQTVILALLYPALLGLVSLGIIAALMTFVVPDITRVFITRGTALPFLTRALIGISAFLKDYGLVVLLGLGAVGAVVVRWLAVGKNRQRFDGWLARNRVTRKIVQRMNAAQFAGTLATLVQSRVPLIEALQAAAGVTPNRFIRARIVQIGDKVRQGMSLKRAMEEAGVFPAMLVAMVASGEASGNLGVALERAASDQQRDLDAWIKALVALVEPGILLIMGGLVMMMVLAILLPIVSMNSLVGL